MRTSKPHQKLAHEMLAQTAKEMAGCWYEEAAHDNEFYAFYPKQKMFINREWHRFIDAAKYTLALMLGNPLTPEWQKERIMDALIKHASLPGNIDKRVAHQMITAGDVPQIQQERI
jgi:hypothetical protein